MQLYSNYVCQLNIFYIFFFYYIIIIIIIIINFCFFWRTLLFY